MLKKYASYFVAYLLDNLKNIENIERVVLYGSAAKNEETKESDVDIFIEVRKISKKLENEIKDIEGKFYCSREAVLFKTKGVENEFSIKIGKLKEWESLQRSIASTGIILYGHYEDKKLPSGVKHFVIIFWDGIDKNRGSFLNKIYGFRIKDKVYKGLLEKYDGKKLGKSCILLPIQYRNDIFKLINKHKVNAKVIEVFI
ncbi:MAG: nucleotidyltransferase domain-containing protein [Nanoarchaeota archaeon]|nr:nucleotidyltransferase domain-containing protein [Nanoarchaeota archaeon]